MEKKGLSPFAYEKSLPTPAISPAQENILPGSMDDKK
jgi:hypothetical protein